MVRSMRMPEGMRFPLERAMGADLERSGLFKLSVATSPRGELAYSLEGVESRQQALDELAFWYRFGDIPQCRDLGVDAIGQNRTVGIYFVRIDAVAKRLVDDELMAIETFDKPGIGEISLMSDDLKLALALVGK